MFQQQIMKYPEPEDAQDKLSLNNQNVHIFVLGQLDRSTISINLKHLRPEAQTEVL